MNGLRGCVYNITDKNAYVEAKQTVTSLVFSLEALIILSTFLIAKDRFVVFSVAKQKYL